MSPLNRSTDSIRKWQVVSSEPLATRGRRDRGKAIDFGAARLGLLVNILRALEPLEIMPPFFFDLLRLDQQEPACRREVGGQIGSRCCGSGSRTVISIASSDCRLRWLDDFEAAQRFDLVAEQLDPHRVVPIGGEDVDNAAARRELARQPDGGGVYKALVGHPAEQFGHVSSSPTWSTRVCRASSSGGGTGCSRLWMLVTMQAGQSPFSPRTPKKGTVPDPLSV